MVILDNLATYLDTLKNAGYLFVGLSFGYYWWEFCENKIPQHISKVNPIWYLIALIWGSSGFFFLPHWGNPLLDLLYYAYPDWGLPISLWTGGELVNHRSWLFNSVLLPALIAVSIPYAKKIIPRKTNIANSFLRFFLNSLEDLSVGLCIAISAHIFSDFFFSWLPSNDTGITLFGRSDAFSYLWLSLNLLCGLGIPFAIVYKVR